MFSLEAKARIGARSGSFGLAAQASRTQNASPINAIAAWTDLS
jgi:hypothetical protein